MVTLFARPGQPLEDHLAGVSRRAVQKATEIGLPPDIVEALRIVGLFHDIGKATTPFNQMLQGVGSNVPHSPWGARYLLEKYKRRALLEAYLVAQHHSGLGKRISFLDGPDRPENPATVLTDPKSQQCWAETQAWMQTQPAVTLPTMSLDAAIRATCSGTRRGADYYHTLRLIMACLVNADHTDSAEAKSGRKPTVGSVLDPDRFQQDILAWKARRALSLGAGGTNVDILNLREAVSEAVQSYSGTARIKLLSADCGSGKTISSVLLGCTCRARRVVYAIPFLSITDQTTELFRDQLKVDVLEHTSRPREETLDPTEAVTQRDQKCNWDHPFVITTTERLSRVLVGRNTTDTRRILSLLRTDTFVIIDEVQNIPPYKLRVYLRELHRLGCSVLLMSATSDLAEMILKDEGLSYDSLGNFRLAHSLRSFHWLPFLKGRDLPDVAKHPQVLSVYNTIRMARAAAKEARRRNHPNVVLLTGRLCTEHRREVLDRVKSHLEQKEPICLISTQVVEAGVDLDFPVLYRQVAPVEAILQAAGRCNREGKLPQGGDVYIWHNPQLFCNCQNMRSNYALYCGDDRNFYIPKDKDYEASTVLTLENTYDSHPKVFPRDDQELRGLYSKLAVLLFQRDLTKPVKDHGTPKANLAFTTLGAAGRDYRPDVEAVSELTLIPDDGDVQVFVDYKGSAQRILAGKLTRVGALQYAVSLDREKSKTARLHSVVFSGEKYSRDILMWPSHLYDNIEGVIFTP